MQKTLLGKLYDCTYIVKVLVEEVARMFDKGQSFNLAGKIHETNTFGKLNAKRRMFISKSRNARQIDFPDIYICPPLLVAPLPGCLLHFVNLFSPLFERILS